MPAETPWETLSGIVRKSPLGDVVVRIDILRPAHPWVSVTHGTHYPDGHVADWPVLGAVPGTPAADALAAFLLGEAP